MKFLQFYAFLVLIVSMNYVCHCYSGGFNVDQEDEENDVHIEPIIDDGENRILGVNENFEFEIVKTHNKLRRLENSKDMTEMVH